MNETAHQSFTELEVWKKARVFKNEIKDLTNSFPSEEKFRLTDQITDHQEVLTQLFPKDMADILSRISFIFALWPEGL